jgi:hypothetical protein
MIIVCRKIFRIARGGKRHTTHGLVIPTPTRSLQTPPQFRRNLPKNPTAGCVDR